MDIVSAKEFLENEDYYQLCGNRYVPEALIKFAALHVQAALLNASKQASLTDFAYEFLQEGASDAIDIDSILNAYPLDNIK